MDVTVGLANHTALDIKKDSICFAAPYGIENTNLAIFCLADFWYKVSQYPHNFSLFPLLNSGNENLRLSGLFFIIVMDSSSLKRSCARALTIAWLHIVRPTHL